MKYAGYAINEAFASIAYVVCTLFPGLRLSLPFGPKNKPATFFWHFRSRSRLALP